MLAVFWGDAHPNLINHGVNTALVEIDTVVSLADNRMKELISNSFARGSIGTSRETSVHFHVIDRTMGLSSMKRVKIHNRHGNNPAPQIIGVNLA